MSSFPLRNGRGFSLVEMMVTMAIFLTVIILVATSFDRIITRSSQETKTAQSQIEGIVGLEMLRRDLAEAGYGLPWSVTGVNFTEVTTAAGHLAPGVDSKLYNNNSEAPIAVRSGNNVGYNGSDYLVVKSTITGLNATAKKWYPVTFSHYTSNRFSSGERLIVLRNRYSSGSLSSKALVSTGGQFTLSYTPDPAAFPVAYRPDQMLENYMAYGVAPPPSGADVQLRMPFNRSDYYIKRPSDAKSIPDVCAKPVDADDTTKGVGILYRSTASQIAGGTGGGYSPAFPLLDCVADMQVVYMLDTNGDGVIDLRANTIPSPSGTEDAATAVRNQVREVRVYVLAQEGRRSKSFTFPADSLLVGEQIPGTTFGRVFTFADQNIQDWRNYNWRVYTLVVPLANLN